MSGETPDDCDICAADDVDLVECEGCQGKFCADCMVETPDGLLCTDCELDKPTWPGVRM